MTTPRAGRRPLTSAPGTTARPGIATVADLLPTVGVEEEFLLLWPDGDAACVAPEVLGAVASELHVQPELMRYQIESTTGICTDLSAVARELSVARRALAQAAADRGARLVAAGTPPFGAPGLAALADDERYRRLITTVPGVTGDEVSCACHVHVGVPTRDLGVAVLNRMRPWLPVLMALTGNSPLWRGADTGWVSYRYLVQRRWPTFAPPPRCPDAAAYDNVVAELVAASAAVDPRSVYFWARLSPRYPTVEIRIPDTCLRAAEAVLMAGLCRALVAVSLADEQAGRPIVDLPDRVVAAAGLSAARWGLDAFVVDPRRGKPVPARVALDALMATVAPALIAAGEWQLITRLLVERLRRGSGAERQRALWRSRDRQVFVQSLANICAGLDGWRWPVGRVSLATG